jgi:uncharacterized repeat protein (TIGR02543 family)
MKKFSHVKLSSKKSHRLKYISIFSTAIMLLSCFYTIIPTVTSDQNDPWTHPNWNYRKEITLNHNKISEDLNDYPLLLTITDNDLENHAQTDADDILFTTKTGIILSHEIEYYDSTSGKLVAWINISYLSSTLDTHIYIYYGNPTCGNQQDPAGTWNNNFMSVHHLKETWGTQAGRFKDSTSNHHDGTLTDANVNSYSDTGIVGQGFRFSGDADRINIGVINQPKPITYSCWLKADNIVLNGCALGRYSYGYYLGTWVVSGTGRLRHNIFINNVTQYNIYSYVYSNTWYHMAVTYDGTNIRYYINGVQVATKAVTGDLSKTTSQWHIGDNGDLGHFFKGVVDEVQIVNTCLSPGWIQTSYNNINDPTSFYTVGLQEIQSIPPTISDEIPVNGASNVPLSPVLQATLSDFNGDDLSWQIWSNVSGIWEILESGTVVGGIGIISAANTGVMSSYNTRYWWSVNVTDNTAWTNETFWFKTLEYIPPTISDEIPVNGASNVPLSPVLQATLSDFNGDDLSWQIWSNVSGIWEILESGTVVGGIGIISAANTGVMSSYNTRYWWSVNVTDNTAWTNETFWFKTLEYIPPTISDEIPVNGASNVPLSPVLQAKISDNYGRDLSWEIKSNVSGIWEILESGTVTGGNGIISTTNTGAMSSHNTRYWWSVEVTDNIVSISKTFYFKTQVLSTLPPVILNPIPSNAEINVPKGNIPLGITINDLDGNLMDVTFKTNATGIWKEIGSNNSQSNGTYSQRCYFSQSNHRYWWSVNCTDTIGWTNATFSFSTKFESGDWWNSAWLYRKWVVINTSLVVGDLVDFPILINIIDNDLKVKTQSSGNDIVFTNETGGILSYELENFTKTSGKLLAWVKIPHLSSTHNTIIFMYYGNPTCGNQQDPAGTWNNNFMSVHHLKETWGTQAGRFKDSTSNHHDGTLTDANVNSYSDTGIVGQGFRFSGDADRINIGVINQPKPITYSCWLKADNIVLNGCALGRYSYGYYLGTWVVSGTGRLRHNIFINNVTQYNIYSYVYSNTWYHMAVTYDGTNIRYYINGVQVATKAVTGDLSKTTSQWHIGDNGDLGHFFKGVVDEVQIANTCFSSGWIRTYYNNLNTPSKFHLLSIEENQSGFPPVISHEKPGNTSINNQFNPTLEVTVTDLNNDDVYCEIWTNISGSWHQVMNTTVYNGSGIISDITDNMIQPLKKYWWSVHTTDLYGSRKWINKTYWFKTGENYPIISDVYPNEQDALYNPVLNVNIHDNQNHPLTVIFRKKVSGIWETIGTYNGYNGVYTQNTQNMDVKDQTYYWSINVSYGTSWINRTYSFRAEPFVLKWTSYNNCITSIGPHAADVNDDGIYEIFLTGDQKVICLNGLNGNLIWEYDNEMIMGHSPFELGDLNNDGIEEVVISCNRINTNGATIALHGNDGSVYWNVDAQSDGKHLVIADVDGTGYPYVYVASDHYGGERLLKLRGTDGAILKETPVYYPCYGGLSAADINNDGIIEIVLGDYNGEPGKGIHCYNGDTLKLIWYQRARADPQLPILVDVNNDGVLDSVTTSYSNGPVQVVNGKTGEFISGYSGLTSPNHSPNSAYDIDGDGRVEYLVCAGSQVKVFDLGTKLLDATLGIHEEPPYMADVIGDAKLEILGTYYNGITIYNSTYKIVATINHPSTRDTLVQDIDNDGRNELIFTDGSTYIKAYETTAYAPTPRVRSVNDAYSERRTGAAVFIPPPGALQPILKEEYPVNGSLDVTLNPTLSVHAVDYRVHELQFNYIVEHHYDKMNITISTNASGTWQNLTSFNNVGNAHYNITSTNMNQPDTTYYWRVTARDINPYANNITTTKTYHFSTISKPKINNLQISLETPYQNQTVNFSSDITENTKMDEVKLIVGYPDGSEVNETMYKYQWTTLAYDDFEQGWGNYTDGGANCWLYSGDHRLIHNGNWAANIEANSGVASSFNLTNPIDLATPGYNAIKIDFWMNAYGMDDGKKYVLEYYDGTQWLTRRTYEQNNGNFSAYQYKDTNKYKFANWIFFHDTVWINKSTYNFPTNMNIRFHCTASNSGDDVYIDQIYINATHLQPTDSIYRFTDNYALAGLYTYSVWCKDINGNTNISTQKQFSVLVGDFTLAILVDPVEGGTVSASPSPPYSYNVVTLTATANPGYTFDHWSGDATGSSPVTTVMMAGDKSVTAHFIPV